LAILGKKTGLFGRLYRGGRRLTQVKEAAAALT